MGISSDGMLFFGIDFGEDLPEPFAGLEDDGGFDFDEWLCERAGLPYKGTETDWEGREAAKAACPVEYEIHCSYDYAMHIFCARGLGWRASRGYPVEIDPKNLIVPQETIDRMKAWFDEVGLPWSEPKWILCSLYG